MCSSPTRCRRQLADWLEALRAARAAEYHDGLSGRRFRSAAAIGASRPPAEGTGVARARRVHRAARRRASGRVCAATRPASRLADRLYRVGRSSDRACATAQHCLSMGGTRCRRPPRSTPAVRNPSPDGGAAGAMARHGAQARARFSATIPGCTRLTRWSGFAPPRKRPVPSSALSHDNPLDRVWPGQPARADRACRAASRAILRRERGVEAHPAGARACNRRGSRQSC